MLVWALAQPNSRSISINYTCGCSKQLGVVDWEMNLKSKKRPSRSSVNSFDIINKKYKSNSPLKSHNISRNVEIAIRSVIFFLHKLWLIQILLSLLWTYLTQIFTSSFSVWLNCHSKYSFKSFWLERCLTMYSVILWWFLFEWYHRMLLFCLIGIVIVTIMLES